jgi:hypothetical protein
MAVYVRGAREQAGENVLAAVPGIYSAAAVCFIAVLVGGGESINKTKTVESVEFPGR